VLIRLLLSLFIYVLGPYLVFWSVLLVLVY
jgi:hypothetical protein